MLEIVSAISLWELVKHASSWVTNLRRARNSRKKESIDALRQVILAAQQTAVYMRQLQDTGAQSHAREAELAKLWTQLAFLLEDLGVEALAKRCRIIGREWVDPQKMDKAFLQKADVGLEKMEAIALTILQEAQ